MADIQLVANHTGQTISLPRVKLANGGFTDALSISAHHVESIPKSLWGMLKSTKLVQHLLSVGSLSEVRMAPTPPVAKATTPKGQTAPATKAETPAK